MPLTGRPGCRLPYHQPTCFDLSIIDPDCRGLLMESPCPGINGPSCGPVVRCLCLMCRIPEELKLVLVHYCRTRYICDETKLASIRFSDGI